ncbi:MAG: hypothetical protein SFX74_11005 [Fimbriimonadaceae bacterium]|nr:hypothetical protein [Fimbriimonadaceae bacterium]
MSVTLAPEFIPTPANREVELSFEMPAANRTAAKTAPVNLEPANLATERSAAVAQPRRVIEATFEPYGDLPSDVEVRQARASRTRRAQSVVGSILAYSFLFAVVTFMVYFVSTLTAQVQVEHARQTQVRAVRSAERAGVSARASHQRTYIANADAIDRPAPSGVVAETSPSMGDRVVAQR